MVGKGQSRRTAGIARRFNAAAIGAGLLLAACSGRPASVAPQATANPAVPPTLAALSHAPAIRDLDGLAPEQVAALIGHPDLRRVDPPAEIWQYRNADCVLNLYFYGAGAASKLVYAETRSRVPERGLAASRCRSGFAPLTSYTRQTKL